jgi:hypothetical protein
MALYAFSVATLFLPNGVKDAKKLCAYMFKVALCFLTRLEQNVESDPDQKSTDNHCI